MKECKNLKNSEIAIENNSFPITNWKGDKRPCVYNVFENWPILDETFL